MTDSVIHLSFEAQRNVLVGRVRGEIDSVTADDLERALAARLANDSRGLVLDLTHSWYLDSAGIELVFDLARRLRTHRQRLRLVLPLDAPLRRVLAMYDIETVAPIHATTEAALIAMGEDGTAHEGE